jgi:hypothetical protein
MNSTPLAAAQWLAEEWHTSNIFITSCVVMVSPLFPARERRGVLVYAATAIMIRAIAHNPPIIRQMAIILFVLISI